MYLASGHKIGKPTPLFNKIEQDRLMELKTRYSGSASAVQMKESKLNKKFANVSEIESAITKQGDKVRSLKISKAEKHEIEEQVKFLLELKSELEKFKKTD